MVATPWLHSPHRDTHTMSKLALLTCTEAAATLGFIAEWMNPRLPRDYDGLAAFAVRYDECTALELMNDVAHIPCEECEVMDVAFERYGAVLHIKVTMTFGEWTFRVPVKLVIAHNSTYGNDVTLEAELKKVTIVCEIQKQNA